MEQVRSFFSKAMKATAAVLAGKNPVAEILDALSKLSTQLAGREADYSLNRINLEKLMKDCQATAEDYLDYGQRLEAEWDTLSALIAKKEGTGLLSRINQLLGSLKVADRKSQNFKNQMQALLSEARSAIRAGKVDLSKCEQNASLIPATLMVAGKVIALISGSWPTPLAWLGALATGTADLFTAYDRIGWIRKQGEKIQKHMADVQGGHRKFLVMEAGVEKLDAAMDQLQEVVEQWKTKMEKKLAQLDELTAGAPKIRCRG